MREMKIWVLVCVLWLGVGDVYVPYRNVDLMPSDDLPSMVVRCYYLGQRLCFF